MSASVALVTGSSRGIGRAAALALAEEGFAVAVNARARSPQLDQTVADVLRRGVRACEAVFDVADIDSHDTVLDAVESALGSVTTLVNNAGVGVVSRGDPLDVTPESYDRCQAVNARGLFFLTRAVARRWLASQSDASVVRSVINVTSANATAVAVPRGEYCASKAAAAMISKVFAARLGPEGIPVFDVQPGLIATDMTRTVIETYRKRAAAGLCLLGRVGEPEELGMVIASLATGKLPYTTGQVISVDGGMLLPRF